MRKLLWLVAVLLVAHVALLFVQRGSAALPPSDQSTDVGIVFDMGGRGDKSFNDGAYLGGERASRDLAAQVRFIEPGDGSDREAGLRLLAAEGMDIVFGVGFIFSDDIWELAKEYPDTKFAGIDFAKTDANGNMLTPPPNLAALKFREEEGSFLVGAIAGLVSKTKKVGFVGGMNFPLIHKFEAGYKAGVKSVCRQCTIVSQYAGVTPEAFRNPGRGKELALSQYSHGVDIIFHASGSTGLGVFEAARQASNESVRKYAIGVDADQWNEAKGYVLTSMVKGVDVAVFEATRWTKDGTFKGGVYQLGLKEGGVGYVYDDNNRSLIPPNVIARVEQLKQEIIAGRIRVPSTL